jgi:low affinity Fe/Cu permease
MIEHDVHLKPQAVQRCSKYADVASCYILVAQREKIMTKFFNRFAAIASKGVGSPYAFIAAVALLIAWIVSGPAFHYSDTWQLIVNTSTTIVTFLMVFLIQNSQNRDAMGLHLKLDELIRATKGARNTMIDLTTLTDRQLNALEEEYRRICKIGDA